MVDDHADMTRLLGEELTEAGFEVLEANSGGRANRARPLHQPDVALTDLRMADIDGLDVLDTLRGLDADLPVSSMTAFGSIDSAVEAMRKGAFTYLAKPFRMDELVLQVQNALALRALRCENRSLRRLVDADGPGGMVGTAGAMRALYAIVDRLAGSDVPVLIRGETGTGKERVARALHFGGPAASGRSWR